jgi:hypothetical protein
LEREKIDALRLNKWNFDAKMMLSNDVTSWEGIKTDFSLCTINPRSEKNCLVISTLAKQSYSIRSVVY